MLRAVVFDCFGVLGGYSAAGWRRDEALLGYIRSELKPKYKVGMLSNLGSASINSLFPPQEREALFDATIVASQVGLTKPQPEIYQLACERLGVMPAEAIFVDDSPENIAGAAAIGMRTVLYRDRASLQHEVAAIVHNLEAYT
jgi:putative hydrolase of the HAD superfamily